MLYPFRFAGDGHHMVVFDALIAFTYAYHVHAFTYRSDIENCGKARLSAFIAFVHSAVLALILAIPKGEVLRAVNRVFWEYPLQIIYHPIALFREIFSFL